MLSFKTIFCIIFLIGSLTIAPCTAVCDGLNHSATFGHRIQDDQIVFQEQVVASWKFLWCTSREVKYPLRGQDQLEITYIEIIDNYSNGYGGCPYIVEGGHDPRRLYRLNHSSERRQVAARHARQHLRLLAPGAFISALPASGQCSLVTDNTVHHRTVSCKKLLGRENQQLDSNPRPPRGSPVR
ncbi:uncharacterized protein isoform X1 [Rhodnius prolixus]|uniref:uncharacterized protein isoform X1 n=1 Tax=Rhodnius prolixus TaxID=13249 RepID=UPI003D18D760